MHEIYKINGNPAGFEDLDVLHKLAQQFLPFAHKKLGFDKPVGINLLSDPENVKDPLGKTGYYDPNKMEITIFVDKRHVKDILRSLSHELVHHTQNCRGEFDQGLETGPGYAQKDPHMRKMEAEAYLLGNGFLFRDWEDHLKLKESKAMAKRKIKEAHDCAVHEGEPHAQWEAKQLGKAGLGPHGILEEDEIDEDLDEDVEELEEGADVEGYMDVPEVGTEEEEWKKLGKALPKVKPGKYKSRPAGPSVPLKQLQKPSQRENWFRGNKDELLFERLVKKWAK